MKRLAAVLAVILLVAAGCGASSGGDTGSSRKAEQHGSALRGVAQFKRCTKEAGAKVKSDAPTLHGRIALGAAGNLPATYVGAVVWPNGAYMDVWFADNARDGAATANRLNRAEAKAQGVTEVEAAFNNGRAVGAPGNTAAFGRLGVGGSAKKIDACLKATNR